MENKNLPTIKDLFQESGNLASAFENEKLNALLMQDPNPKWVKNHPYISNYKYLPIDKIEFLLKKIFKKHRIEVLREGTAFNGVYVVVRVHYLNPVSGGMDFHDGIGAAQLQTKSGTSASDLININNGAIAMAFPLAKTVAVKDACDHFGRIFGSDLNRKDLLSYSVDNKLQEVSPETARIVSMLSDCNTIEDVEILETSNPDIDVNLFSQRKEELKNG
jgi:hypothetical protein